MDDDETIDSDQGDDPLATSKPELEETIDSGASNAKPEIRMNTIQQIGDYAVEKEIARGGMGVVYQARHRTLNRTVALKMILSGQFASEADVRRFHQEAEAAANLDHSGIVPIYDIGEHEGQHYFSMKFIEGGSLAEKLPELRKDRRKVVRLLAQIARAMHHAHQRGILHRDLKPANILLDEEGNPLVSDLGLAKQIKDESNLTHTGAVVGTPAYMPPEQAAAKKEITTAADIYSLGAILYEALTGRPPFKGQSPVETMMQVINGEMSRPRDLDSSIDRTLELICLKCLEKDPEQRYSSAAALADDLENWAEGNPVSVKPPSLGGALTQALVANVRSVLGAGLLGILAGILFASSLSRMHNDNSIVQNPPAEVYRKLPGEIPPGKALVFLNETENQGWPVLLGSLGTMGTLIFTGLFVALLTRPKPGSEALVMAVVTSTLMSITLFTVYLSLGAVGDTHKPARRAIGLLTVAAYDEGKESAGAKKLLQETYPGLDQLPASERANTLAFRVYYDGLFRSPRQILQSMAISVLICTLPVLLGTIFGSRLIHRRERLWGILPVYFEFMLLLIFLGFIVFLQTVIPWIDPAAKVPPIGLVGNYGRQILVYGFMGFMAVTVYRQQIRWYWRLAMYAGFVAVCLVAF